MNFKYYKSIQLIIFLLVLYVVSTKLIIEKLLPVLEGLPLWANEILDILGLISPVAFIGFTLWLIENVFWKYKIAHWLIKIPNLNGRYEGSIISDSYTDQEGKKLVVPFALEIKQKASNIVIVSYYLSPVRNVESKSISIIEHIEKRRTDIFKIYFVYENDPGNAKGAEVEPFGSAFFEYNPLTKKISGGYYNRRPHSGSFDASFKSYVLEHGLGNVKIESVSEKVH